MRWKRGISCPLTAGQSLHPINTVVQSKIYWRLLARLPWSLSLIFMVARGWFLMILLTLWTFVQHCHQVKISPSSSFVSKNQSPDADRFSVDIHVLREKVPRFFCTDIIDANSVFLYPSTSHNCSVLGAALLIVLCSTSKKVQDYTKLENTTVPWWRKGFKASQHPRLYPGKCWMKKKKHIAIIFIDITFVIRVVIFMVMYASNFYLKKKKKSVKIIIVFFSGSAPKSMFSSVWRIQFVRQGISVIPQCFICNGMFWHIIPLSKKIAAPAIWMLHFSHVVVFIPYEMIVLILTSLHCWLSSKSIKCQGKYLQPRKFNW